jgi:RNA polymerase sigma factor (sigma-70 family)
VSLGDQFHSILQAARTGAEWAWVALYREVAPVVVRYLRARGASEPDDVLGEVMVRVVLKLAQFQGGASEFRAWVLAIARNRLFDEFRRRSRRPVDPAPDERVVASGPIGDAEDDALRRLEAQRVRSILGRLSPDQRDVLLLRILGRLTIEEVARVVGKRPGAVKALQARGLAAIRRAISAEAVSL